MGKLWQAYSLVCKFKEIINFSWHVVLRDICAWHRWFGESVVSTLLIIAKRNEIMSYHKMVIIINEIQTTGCTLKAGYLGVIQTTAAQEKQRITTVNHHHLVTCGYSWLSKEKLHLSALNNRYSKLNWKSEQKIIITRMLLLQATVKRFQFDLYVNLEGQHMLISSWFQK